MAKRIFLFGRSSSLQLNTNSPASPTTLSSLFFCSSTAHCFTTAIATASASHCSEVEQQQQQEKGKWFTLPPFTPTINPTSVAKQLSRSSQQTSDETSNTPASKWILQCCPQLPRSLIQKLFRLRQVRRESCSLTTPSVLGTKVQENRLKRVSAKDAMNLGDKIYLPFSVQEVSSERQECHYNEDEKNYIQSLELYKDPAIIVINKPPGMPVQGGIGIQKSLDVLAATCLKFECSEPPRLVHRLDRDSSGILVMGRTQTSAVVLHSMFREKTFGASTSNTDNDKAVLQRKYWALVLGTPRRASGFISAPLGKVVIDNGKSERITVIDDTKHMPFQHAVTKYRVIEQSLHGYTWLELCPLTGRKHQLRVHCAEVLGTPIVGDYKYGWQAHRKWKPVPWPENKLSEKVPEWKMFPLGHALDSGSITEKQPHLHLHCKRMILPNISLALQYMKSKSKHDFSELESLDLVAPLPSHMQRSWDILRS